MTEPTRPTIPHSRTVTALCIVILIGFSAASYWALTESEDATIIGAVIQTWVNGFVAVTAFWLGSSSGGKLSK